MKKQIIKESVESDARRAISNDETSEVIAQKIQNILAFFSGLNKAYKQNIKQKIGDILWLSALQFVKDGLHDGDISSGDIEILLDNLYEKYLSKLNKETTKKEDVDKLFISVKNGIKQNKSVEDILESALSFLEQKELGYSLDNLFLEEIRQLGKDAIDRGDSAFKNLLKQYERRGELTALYDSPDCVIYLINTMEASVACGAFTEWCTARTDKFNQFDRYAFYGLSLIWFSKEKHTYIWNGANITFGKRFGVTLNDFPRGQAQTEVHEYAPDEIKDLLYEYIGKEETEDLLGRSKQVINNREKEKILTAIESGADINELLIKTSKSGNTEIVELLLKHRADINAKDKYEKTALMLASERGFIEIVKLLLETGADVNAKDNIDHTALIDASDEGYIEIVKLLIDAGADVNAKTEDGWTALMLASRYGHPDIVKLLLEAGAEVDPNDKRIMRFIVNHNLDYLVK